MVKNIMSFDECLEVRNTYSWMKNQLRICLLLFRELQSECILTEEDVDWIYDKVTYYELETSYLEALYQVSLG